MIQLGRAFLVVSAILCASCGSTFLTKTWHDKTFAGPPLRKVLICALDPDPATQRLLEDAFVRELRIRGVHGVECHNLLPPGNPSGQQLQEVAARAGADGFIVTSPPVLKEFPVSEWGPGEDGPPYLEGTPEIDSIHDAVYREVEIPARAYVAPTTTSGTPEDREMVWSGTSRTLSPTSVRSLVSEAVPKFISAMTKAGVLPPPPAS